MVSSVVILFTLEYCKFVLGGPWVLPPSRPVCLRPMLLRKEYRAFAEDINNLMAWSPLSLEALCCSAARFVIPPMAAVVMVSTP